MKYFTPKNFMKFYITSYECSVGEGGKFHVDAPLN